MDTISHMAHDRALADAVFLRLRGVDDNLRKGQPFIVEFQFPPKVVSDNRGANWSEISMKASEPVPIFADSTARELTLEWSYIVTDVADGGGNIAGRGGGRWTTERIHRQVYSLRRYFGGSVAEAGSVQKLIVDFKMWSVGGQETMTFRMISASINHSKTIVAPVRNESRSRDEVGRLIGGDIDPTTAYPLRTDVSIQLKTWTQMGGVAGRGGDNVESLEDVGAQFGGNADSAKIAVSGLEQFYKPEWF